MHILFLKIHRSNEPALHVITFPCVSDIIELKVFVFDESEDQITMKSELTFLDFKINFPWNKLIPNMVYIQFEFILIYN